MTPDEERLRRAAAFVAGGMRGGDFAPRVDRVLSGLDQVVAAHEHLESDAQVGKIVPCPWVSRRASSGPGYAAAPRGGGSAGS